MEYTTEILNKLKVDKNIIKLAAGATEIPYIGDDFQSPKEYWHPHPPVLVPMFTSYGFHYYGVLKHWFIDRQETFVEFEAEWGFMLEYARNAEQFCTLTILNMIMVEETLNDRILEFARNVNFDNPQKIAQFAEEYGDDNEYFSELEGFTGNVPLTYLDSLADYKGDYPSSEKLFNKSVIDKTCSLEIAKRQYLIGLETIPEWLDENIDKKTLFDKFTQEDNLAGAWLTLNSLDDKGMTLPEIAEGLEYLKTRNDDSLFQMIADNWIHGWQNSSF